jgi:hypothetical protein
VRLRRRPNSREGYHNICASESLPSNGPVPLVYHGGNDFAWFRYEFAMSNSGGTSTFAVDIEREDLREMITILAQLYKADEFSVALTCATTMEKMSGDLISLEQRIEALTQTVNNLQELCNDYQTAPSEPDANPTIPTVDQITLDQINSERAAQGLEPLAPWSIGINPHTFMLGHSDGWDRAKCATCGKLQDDPIHVNRKLRP